MAGDGAERTEKPTPRRREEARKKGQIARSQDLGGAFAALVIIAVAPGLFSSASKALTYGFRSALENASRSAASGDILRATAAISLPLLTPVMMLFAVAMGAGLVANFAQVGLHFNSEGLKPQFNRLNPMEGFKRIFSKNGLFETGKSLAKSVLFFLLGQSVLRAHWDEILSLSNGTAASPFALIGELMYTMLMRLGAAWLIISFLDYAFQRYRTEQQLMMTKDEVRQEMKDAESSPELKSHRNAMRKKFAKRNLAQAVKTADVIVTNPTHFSVAIRYEALSGHAPVVVAKGVDHLAFRIRELAKQDEIPIVPNPPLARALYRECEIGDYVPRDLFGPVAEVLAYVYKTLGRTRK